jgi:hypothetical protein
MSLRRNLFREEGACDALKEGSEMNLELKSTVAVTPRVLAECFWNMDDRQQAQFFADLKDVIAEQSPDAYCNGQVQWCYLSDRLNENLKAKEMACEMMAWFFNHTTDFLSRRI